MPDEGAAGAHLPAEGGKGGGKPTQGIQSASAGSSRADRGDGVGLARDHDSQGILQRFFLGNDGMIRKLVSVEAAIFQEMPVGRIIIVWTVLPPGISIDVRYKRTAVKFQEDTIEYSNFPG